MGELKEFKPSTKEGLKPFGTTQGKPEKPGDIFTNEEFEKRRQKMASSRSRTEEKPTKSVAQIKGEIRQRFMEKIKEIKKQFEKLDEGNK